MKRYVNYIKFNRVLNKIDSMLSKNKNYKSKDLYNAKEKAVILINEILNNKKTSWTLLKRGNHKLEKNILIWDLPEGLTCRGLCSGCYACKASKQYPETRVMRLYHLILVEYAFIDNFFYYKLLEVFKRELQRHHKYCTKKGIMSICRIHSSGDIYSNEYKQFVLDIVNLNDNINFYTYTKFLPMGEIDEINNTIVNLNIVKSIFTIKGKTYINFGTPDYIENLKKVLDENGITYHHCQYGKLNAPTCGIGCTACINKDIVIFDGH